MERQGLKSLIGLAMVGIGVVQMGLSARDAEGIPTGLGLLYGGIGIAYLWAEVYAPDQ